ncbi:uncharacterized protein LOC113288658 isoform X2 [Papaver somniferum]|uniref:uncharacterized protein LOC113288658 isoform X2 n=1 Tax=Papaver somniferum TaxID=3469 RepID=UPI000E6FBF5F|nr:uncharacterized protein LOC113288658 isoform X2 [Papaver somniferum]
MEDKLPDRHRSPRLIARLQELSTTEDVEERQCYRQLDAHQTDSQLQLRRISVKAKHNLMTENEREAHLERCRNAYRMQRIRAVENRNQQAGTSCSSISIASTVRGLLTNTPVEDQKMFQNITCNTTTSKHEIYQIGWNKKYTAS